MFLHATPGASSPRTSSVPLGPLPQPGWAPTRAHGIRCGRAGSAPGAPRGRATARAAAAAAAAATAAAAPRLPGAAPARPPGALRPPYGAGQARGGRGCGRSESGRKRSARPGGGRQEGRRAGQEIPHRLPDPGPAAAGQAAAPAPRARPHPPTAPPPLSAAPAPTRQFSNLGANLEGARRSLEEGETSGGCPKNPESRAFLFPPQTPTFLRSGPFALTERPGQRGEGSGGQGRDSPKPTSPPAPWNGTG